MAKTGMIRARVEPELKRGAERVLETLGLTPTEAITLFYKQVTLHRGLPFVVRVPKPATRRAMRDARAGRDLAAWDGVEALKATRR